MRPMNTEEQLCVQLAGYLRARYPRVLYHFDYGSGLRMTLNQAVRQKRLNARAWPDLTIAVPRSYGGRHYCGLYIEVKRAGTRLKLRDGRWATEHIAEQATVLSQLARDGYIAQFGCGYEECVQLIDSYLGASTEASAA